jgi:hypothetical protein
VALLAVLVARTPSNAKVPFLPPGSDGIVALDLSASASATEYTYIHRYLTQIIDSRGRFGLVVFSDTAYETLPPNAPSSAFATVARYFQGPVYPTNPWAGGFSLGTSISKALDLAREVILGDGVRRRNVWLISDLSDAPEDLPLLNASLQSYSGAGIDLHVLPVDATAADLAPYRRLFGTQSPTISVKPLPVVPPVGRSYGFPLLLAVVAIILAVALAVNELVSPPLRWRPLRVEPAA